MNKTKLNANVVGENCIRPHFEARAKNKGITLIALIITIIVMLILVGVTISVALNGGLFGKAEKAGYQTNASTIKEQLALKKAELIAEANGKQPETYTIKISDLAIPEKMIKEFGTKLIISSEAELYYDAAVVTEKEEQDWLKEIGITEYIGGPIPPPPPAVEPPTLELEQIDAGTYTDHTLIGLNINFNSFELEYSILEESYSNNKSDEQPETLEQFLVEMYNEVNETAYKNKEEIGMTKEELINWYEYIAETTILDLARGGFFDSNPTFTITRPDNSKVTFDCDENYSSSKELEGIYYYNSLRDLECKGYCYSATQTGKYEITTTIGDYVVTDTIMIENL